MHTLYIGGIPLTDYNGTVNQQYEPIGGDTLLRMASGKAKKRQHWQKWQTTISGSGWLPLGLGSLDYSKPIEIACIKPMSISSPSSRVFELPGNRRLDVLPWGLALVEHEWFETAVTLDGNLATLDNVVGARLYQVLWLPLLTVFMSNPTEQVNTTDASYDWTIEAQEE